MYFREGVELVDQVDKKYSHSAISINSRDPTNFYVMKTNKLGYFVEVNKSTNKKGSYKKFIFRSQIQCF